MRDFYIGLILAIAYFVFGKLSAFFGVSNSIITISLFPPEGIALAFALLFSKRVVWGIFVGQTLFALSNDLGFATSISIGVTNTLEALIAIYFANRWKVDLQLNTLYSVSRFFILVIFILQPLSALSGNTLLLLFGNIPAENFIVNTFSWYFGNLIAQLVITPMLLLLYQAYKTGTLHIFKLLLTLFAFSISLYLLVIQVHIDNMALLLSIVIVALFVVSYRFGTVYSAVGINVISIGMMLFTHDNIGAFTQYDKLENIINLNFFELAQVLVFYVHQAMYREKEHLLLELHNANKDLNRRVKEEVNKNREKEKFLMYQSRLAQMGEMINMIAHQWRQPLNSVSIIIQTIGMKFKKDALSKEAMEEFQTKVLHQIDYMSETIDSFRDFFKPEKEKKEFSLQDVILYVVNISKFEMQKNSIGFEYHQDAKLMLVGYPNELGQAILNIVNNARDQLLKMNPEKKKITITIRSEIESVTIEIADTAGGVDEKNKEKIFEPYFSTKEAKNGTGLGLYITKMIIEEHMQGKLFVKNSDEGALFTIKLPTNKDKER